MVKTTPPAHFTLLNAQKVQGLNLPIKSFAPLQSCLFKIKISCPLDISLVELAWKPSSHFLTKRNILYYYITLFMVCTDINFTFSVFLFLGFLFIKCPLKILYLYNFKRHFFKKNTHSNITNAFRQILTHRQFVYLPAHHHMDCLPCSFVHIRKYPPTVF